MHDNPSLSLPPPLTNGELEASLLLAEDKKKAESKAKKAEKISEAKDKGKKGERGLAAFLSLPSAVTDGRQVYSHQLRTK